MGSFSDNGSVNKTLCRGWNHAIFFVLSLVLYQITKVPDKQFMTIKLVTS